MHAYNEIYLSSSQEILAALFDYGINFCGVAAEEFWSRFIASGIAERFACGNPAYVAGRAGSELAMMILQKTGSSVEDFPEYHIDEASPEYWAGWALAYYQWDRALDFESLPSRGLTFTRIVSMYSPFHEADITKFVSAADSIISSGKASSLRQARLNIGLTQQELADVSDVSLRMIRAYEQGSQDIRKAEAETVLRLSRALRIDVSSLITGYAGL